MSYIATGTYVDDEVTGDQRWVEDDLNVQWVFEDDTGDWCYGPSAKVMYPIVAVVYSADMTVRYVNSVPQATSTPGLFVDVTFALVDEQPPGPTIPVQPNDWLLEHAFTAMIGNTILWRGDDGMGNVIELFFDNDMYAAVPAGWLAADFAATGQQSEVFQPFKLNSDQSAYEPDPDGAPYTFAWTVVATPPVFDPGLHNVTDVIEYVDAHPDEADAIEAAERSGKARSTLLAYFDGRSG